MEDLLPNFSSSIIITFVLPVICLFVVLLYRLRLVGKCWSKSIDLVMIGIGGCSCSGKSTLAKSLASYLGTSSNPCPTVHVDKFFKPESEMALIETPNSERFRNWEIPSSTDFARAVQFIEQVKSKMLREMDANSPRTMFIIVEGFLIYAHKPLLPMFDVKFFLKINRETSYARRMQNKPVPETYFHSVIWPMHLKHGQPPQNGLIHTLDGTLKLHCVVQKAIDVIHKQFNLPNDVLRRNQYFQQQASSPEQTTLARRRAMHVKPKRHLPFEIHA